MTFIGPGSEWFWSALSGIVLAVTFIALYRQLRLQANTAAVEQLTAFETEWASERLTRFRLDVVRALRAGTDPALLPDGPMYPVFNFWERIGSLAKSGHLDVDLLMMVNLGVCQTWWAAFRPWVMAQRAKFAPTFGESWEWLATEVKRKNDQMGTRDMDSLGDLDALVAEIEYRLGVAVALRTDNLSPAGREGRAALDGPPRTTSTVATGRSGSSRGRGSPAAPSG